VRLGVGAPQQTHRRPPAGILRLSALPGKWSPFERYQEAASHLQKKDATILNNSNAIKAVQAALVAKPKGMVALTRISRIEQSPLFPHQRVGGGGYP
jgi:hypothetical protein